MSLAKYYHPFWKRCLHRLIMIGAVVAGVAATSAPATAQSVVVRSTGPSAGQFPTGKKLTAGASVTLRSGDRVTVLDKGGTRVLTGPGRFSLSSRSAAASSGPQLSSFLASRANRRSRTGAVRGAGSNTPGVPKAPARSPNLWFVDTAKGGIHCVADPNALILWRPDVSHDVEAQLSTADGSQRTAIGWRRGNALKLWPKEAIGLVDEGRYALDHSSHDQTSDNPAAAGGTGSNITIKMMDSIPQSLDATAEVLIAKGCQAQLDLLVDTLASNTSSDSEDAG